MSTLARSSTALPFADPADRVAELSRPECRYRRHAGKPGLVVAGRAVGRSVDFCSSCGPPRHQVAGKRMGKAG